MKTPIPAKTNVPPRNPRTRTSTACVRFSCEGAGAAPMAAAISAAESWCCRARAAMSTSARVRALISDTSALSAVGLRHQPSEGYCGGGIRVLKRRGQFNGDDTPLAHQYPLRVVPMHSEQFADETGSTLTTALVL